MIRKNKFNPDLIITADWHLMEEEKQPPCRLDSIWNAQWDKINQIKELQEKYDCAIINSGDIFEHWKASPKLINYCISLFPKDIFSIAGNHDTPQHNFDLIEKSAWWTLVKCKTINFLKYGSWGQTSDKINSITFFNKKIVIVHMMTWQGEEPWPGCTDPESNKVFKMFPKADLIITGHNHKTFTAKKGKQLLINPGSLTRHKADQIDHKPCVFLWEAKTNTYRIHYLKIKKDVISREHIEIVNQKEKNLTAFISKLNDGWDITLSFKDNIEKAIQENNIPIFIENIIREWMEK